MTEHKRQPRLKKSLGQNFLKDANIAARIAACLKNNSTDTVLEIGPGAGALTKHILKTQPKQYIAVEKDTHWAAELTKLPAPENTKIKIHNQDALTLIWEEFTYPIYIIGNLPYNVASPLMWEICSRVPQLQQAVFMIQKEVGERIVAKPGSKIYGGLSVWLQNFIEPKWEFIVPPHVFTPAPKVDSVVLSFIPKNRNTGSDTEKIMDQEVAIALAELIHVCFQQRRKQLQKILRTKYGPEALQALTLCKIAETSRPEELSPQQFRLLATKLLGANKKE